MHCMPAFGINIDEWLAEKVDRPLEYGDSRSDRIAGLLRVGIAAEETAKPIGWWPDDIEDREQMVADAIELYIEEQSE